MQWSRKQATWGWIEKGKVEDRVIFELRWLFLINILGVLRLFVRKTAPEIVAIPLSFSDEEWSGGELAFFLQMYAPHLLEQKKHLLVIARERAM